MKELVEISSDERARGDLQRWKSLSEELLWSLITAGGWHSLCKPYINCTLQYDQSMITISPSAFPKHNPSGHTWAQCSGIWGAETWPSTFIMSWYLAKLRYNLPIYQKTAHGQCSSREKGKNINFKLATVTTATVKQNKSATSIPGIVLYSSVRRPLQLVKAAWEPGDKDGLSKDTSTCHHTHIFSWSFRGSCFD